MEKMSSKLYILKGTFKQNYLYLANNVDDTVNASENFDAESSSSSESTSDYDEDGFFLIQDQITPLISANYVSERNGILWEHFSSVSTGRVNIRAQNVFVASFGIPRKIATSIAAPYDA